MLYVVKHLPIPQMEDIWFPCHKIFVTLYYVPNNVLRFLDYFVIIHLWPNVAKISYGFSPS